MSTFTPAVIIIAFNRPESLQRLLHSVSGADYLGLNVPLCICIDFQDSEANRKVAEIAEAYEWQFGVKEVIWQRENLGLKNHVLRCGDLVERFGSIIMLEDDLFVSPAYYSYTVQALDFYKDESEISGISLYNHKSNFSNRAPFSPLEDGSDVYFLQIASSWGQAWSSKEWGLFRAWLRENPVISEDASVPAYVSRWPDKSWLKHYIVYLSKTNRFFAFPRVSLTTNFGDAGENNGRSKIFFQVPLLQGTKSFTFSPLGVSPSKYDSFFDLLPDVIIAFNPDLVNYDFINNLSGLKNVNMAEEGWVLGVGSNTHAKLNYAIKMKPLEMNILHRVPGNGIYLAKNKHVVSVVPDYETRKILYDYKYGIITLKEKLQNIIDVIRLKISRL